MSKLKIGSKFKLSDDAIENYGEEYRSRIFTVTSVANKYMPSSEFFRSGKPSGYHPGYDEGLVSNGRRPSLYDAEELEFSVYDWEVIPL